MKNLLFILLLFTFTSCKEKEEETKQGIIITTLSINGNENVIVDGQMYITHHDKLIYPPVSFPKVEKNVVVDLPITKGKKLEITFKSNRIQKDKKPLIFQVSIEKGRYTYFTIIQHNNGSINVMSETISK